MTRPNFASAAADRCWKDILYQDAVPGEGKMQPKLSAGILETS